MTETAPESPPDAPAETKAERKARRQAEKAAKPRFTFTDDGCRIEIRIGTLLVLAAVFVWLWLGPAVSQKLAIVGIPAVLIGVVLQVRDRLRLGRPGFPWKIGIALAFGGLAMTADLSYREAVGGALQFQEVGPLLLIPGVWMLGWWPVDRMLAKRAQQEAVV